MRIINDCCDTCLHKKVCKNVENAKNVIEIMKETIINKNDKLNFTIKIICDDYHSNVSIKEISTKEKTPNYNKCVSKSTETKIVE